MNLLATAAFLGATLAPTLEATPSRRHRAAAKRPAKARTSAESTLPAAIQDPEALASFFADLAALGAPGAARALRILHFGDSHTAADYWTGRLRHRFQMTFGNAGQGLLLPARPWRGYHHEGISMDFRTSWPAASLRGRNPEPQVGLPGAALAIPEGQRLELTGSFGPFRIHALGEAASLELEPWDPAANGRPPGILPPMPAAPATLDPPPPLPPPMDQALSLGTGTLHLQRQDALPYGSYRLRIALPAGARLLGVDLQSGQPGILYDELGLNGGEFLDLEAWDPALRKALLAEAAPSLVVLAYGTNEAGHPALDLGEYRTRVTHLLKTLKAEAPGAAFLVVGPPDRSARRRKQILLLNERVPATARALRAAATDAGCAFWDARAAMGGPGAMARWRKQGLAQRDLVHLAGPGYQRLGDLLYTALMDARPRQANP